MVDLLTKFILVIFISLGINQAIQAQIKDTLIVTSTPDSVTSVKDTLKVATTSDTLIQKVNPGVDLKSPRTAMFRSIMFPGLGQLYNKSYWKIPVIYAAIGGATYLAIFNQGQYHRFKKAYRQDVDQEIHEFSGRLDRESLKFYRDKYQKDMELSYIGIVAVYGLNILDAFVDAHLQSFDISEDISMKVKPGLQQINLGYSTSPSAGLAISFNLH